MTHQQFAKIAPVENEVNFYTEAELAAAVPYSIPTLEDLRMIQGMYEGDPLHRLEYWNWLDSLSPVEPPQA